MVIQTAIGWILDVLYDHATSDINLLIKLQDGKVISFRQKLNEYNFYILAKSQLVAGDLFQQLSRNDQIMKKKLKTDSRIRSSYNTELSATQHFIYNQLRIAPTSKVSIGFEGEKLISIKKLDDNKEDVTSPPLKIMHIR